MVGTPPPPCGADFPQRTPPSRNFLFSPFQNEAEHPSSGDVTRVAHFMTRGLFVPGSDVPEGTIVVLCAPLRVGHIRREPNCEPQRCLQQTLGPNVVPDVSLPGSPPPASATHTQHTTHNTRSYKTPDATCRTLSSPDVTPSPPSRCSHPARHPSRNKIAFSSPPLKLRLSTRTSGEVARVVQCMTRGLLSARA